MNALQHWTTRTGLGLAWMLSFPACGGAAPTSPAEPRPIHVLAVDQSLAVDDRPEAIRPSSQPGLPRTRAEVETRCVDYAGASLEPAFRLPPWAWGGAAEPPATQPVSQLVDEVDAATSRLQGMALQDPARPDLLRQIATNREAIAAADEGQRDAQMREAIRGWARLIQDHPQAAAMDATLFRLARLLELTGQPQRARQVYHRLVRAHPTSPLVSWGYLSFGEHYFAERDFGAAAQFYDRARQTAQDGTVGAYAAYMEAWCRHHLPDPDGAMDAMLAAFEVLRSGPTTATASLAAAAEQEACTLVGRAAPETEP